MKKKKKELPWTDDIREIERRMVDAGMLKSTLIYSAKDIKKAKKR